MELEAVVLTSSDAEFDDWMAVYGGRAPGPVHHAGRWYVPRSRKRERASSASGARIAYRFMAERVPTPAPVF